MRDQPMTAPRVEGRPVATHAAPWGGPGVATAPPNTASRQPSVAHTRLSVISGALCGLALVASTFLAWPAEGMGSGLAAHRLADVLMSDAADPWVPAWLGLAVYVVPAAGALVMVASGLDIGVAPYLKAAALVPAALFTVLAAVALSKGHPFDLGPGARLALLGLVFGLLSVLADRRCAVSRRP